LAWYGDWGSRDTSPPYPNFEGILSPESSYGISKWVK
jgi:hypothetical protein